MKSIRFLLQYSPKLFALAALAGAIAGVTNAALVIVINMRLEQAGVAPRTLLLAFSGLVIVSLAFGLASRMLLVHLSQQSMFEMRVRLSRQILQTPLRSLEQIGAHRLLNTLTHDITAITTALTEVPFLCTNLAVVAACLIYLGWLSPSLLAAVAVFLVAGLVTYRLPRRWARRVLQRSRAETDVLVQHFQALTQGVKELKLHRDRRRAFENDLLNPAFDSYRKHFARGRHIYAIVHSWGQVLYLTLIGAVIFVLPASQEITVATLAAFTVTLLYMRGAFGALTDLAPTLTLAGISLRAVEGLGLSLTAGDHEPEGHGGRQPWLWRRIDLVDIEYSYTGPDAERSFVLGPLSVTIERGEVVFLTGGNGSGKTTIAKLLCGLYEPDSGRIEIDGIPVTTANRDRYRQLFSAVFTDCFLFDRLLGLEDAGLDARARSCLVTLQLAHKVQVEGGRLSSTELSQGQRKRLALLTAFLEDRPIYIFDEWAAEQDPDFRRFFYREFLPALKASAKTLVVISHDDRYYGVADRLIKLDSGQLAAATPLLAGVDTGVAHHTTAI